jgi:hypothetical protein
LYGLTGIWPPAAIVFAVSRELPFRHSKSASFLIELLNLPRPVDDNNSDGRRFENNLRIPLLAQHSLNLLQISTLPGLQVRVSVIGGSRAQGLEAILDGAITDGDGQVSFPTAGPAVENQRAAFSDRIRPLEGA